MPSEIPTATFSTLRLARADYGPQLELLVALLAARLVHPGQTAVDGGSNTGLHALALARLVGPTGHVLCVEPVPEVAVKLVRHLADGRRQGRTCEEFLGFFADLDYRVFDLHGRSLDAASWADEDMSFELLAWPAEDDRLPMVLATMRWFWETAADRPPATWHDCWVHCRDPLAYLRGIGAVPLGSDGLPAG